MYCFSFMPREISREKLEEKIDNFERKGWDLYFSLNLWGVVDPEQTFWPSDVFYEYSEKENRLFENSMNAIRLINLYGTHINRFPGSRVYIPFGIYIVPSDPQVN